MVIHVYVDDLIVTGSSVSTISMFINHLCSTFDSRQLGDLGYFLGIETTRTESHLHLNQTRYAIHLLTRCNIGIANRVLHQLHLKPDSHFILVILFLILQYIGAWSVIFNI